MSVLEANWSLSFAGLATLAACTFILLAVYQRALNSANTRNRKMSKSTKTVVLTGPLAAGKTALFSKVSSDWRLSRGKELKADSLPSQLLYGHAPQTHTSMKENEGLLKQHWAVTGAKEALLEKAEEPTAEVSTSHVPSVQIHRTAC